MVLLRANALAKGVSGCRPLLVENLLHLLNVNILPKIPMQGSCGSSGDLAPLAHLGLMLIGDPLGEAMIIDDIDNVAAEPENLQNEQPEVAVEEKEASEADWGEQFEVDEDEKEASEADCRE